MRIRALWLLLLASSCSGREQALQFNLGTEALQLDWNRSLDTSSAVLLDNVMEGLTSYADSLRGGEGVELLRPMPALAYSWSESEGGKLYRFHLRSKVFWSDGVELVAAHFVQSWRRLLDPASGSPNAYQLFDLENAAEFASGALRDFSRVGVRAVDPYTLEVRLRRPVPYFLHLVASPATFPVRIDLIRKHGDQWMDPGRLVTLGPYRIAEWKQGEQVTLEAFSGYYGAAPRISRVICRMVTEPLTAYSLYENELLDVLPRDLPPSLLGRLKSHPDYRSGPKLAENVLLFNVGRPPFHLAANRRAFIRAMKREELLSPFEGAQTPVSSWIPPGLLGHSAGLGIPAGGESAPRLSERTLTLRFSGNDTWNLVFQSLQRSVAERLQGQKLKLEALEGREYQKLLSALSGRSRPRAEQLPDLLLFGWVADYPDPHNFMNLFTSRSENNLMRWSHPRYDALVESAVSIADEEGRRRLYEQAQRLLLEEEAILMPLSVSSHQALVRSSLHGVHLNVLDKWYFSRVEFQSGSWRGFSSGVLRRLKRASGSPGSS